MAWEAVHELPILLCTAAGGELGGDLEASELLHLGDGLGFLAHGHPGVGYEDVGILNSLFWNVGLSELAWVLNTLGLSKDYLLHLFWDGEALG